MKNLRMIGVLAMFVCATSALGQEVFNKAPAGTTVTQIGAQRNGGILAYGNDFPESDTNAACGPGSWTCDSCGDFFVSSVWTAPGGTGDRRYIADDITLGAGPTNLVRYDYEVCVSHATTTSATVTSELWTINLDGNPLSQPGAPIAGTLSSTVVPVTGSLSCYIVTVKATPGAVVLPPSFHLLVTTTLQAGTFPVGTFMAVLDTAEYGSSGNQFRRTITGLAAPSANTNANWRPASAGGGAPTCPVAPTCTDACNPVLNFWAHVYTEAICGNGLVETGEDCEPPSSGCCDATCHFTAAGTLCRASAGVCDVAESCTGQSAACPPDMLAAAGTPCRPSTGACDPAEDCDGQSAACPPDVTITQCVSGDGCCPAGCNNGNDADCPLVVPTVSEWGLALLTLIGVVMGAVVFSRKANAARA